MSKCFADNITNCEILRERNCEGCNFYKSEASQLKTFTEDVIKEIGRHRGLISEQKLKTLRGQAISGDAKGAIKGLNKLIRNGGL